MALQDFCNECMREFFGDKCPKHPQAGYENFPVSTSIFAEDEDGDLIREAIRTAARSGNIDGAYADLPRAARARITRTHFRAHVEGAH